MWTTQVVVFNITKAPTVRAKSNRLGVRLPIASIFVVGFRAQIMRVLQPLATDAAAFNHSGWPCTISGTVRVVPSWVEKDNSASKPPVSPACLASGAKCGAPQAVVFVVRRGRFFQ